MIDFPATPTPGQIYNSGTGPIYIWDGVAWNLSGTANPPRAWELIENRVITAQPNSDFPNLAPFRTLRLTGSLLGTISPGGICYRVSSDNGATWNAGATDYSYDYLLWNGVTPTTSAGTASLGYLANGSTDANTTHHFSAIFENFNVAIGGGIDRGVLVQNKGRVSGGISASMYGSAINTTPADNALRLLGGGGGTITGHVILEGVRG